MRQHIRSYFDMISRILKEESDWDLMYYLDTITTWDEALEVIKTLRNKLVDMSVDELTKSMEGVYPTKEDLLARFEFIIEKQRGYPLWMWEYWDLEERAEDWANAHWYGYLFKDED